MCLLCTVLPGGSVVAEVTNPAVTSSTIGDMKKWMKEGCSFEKAVDLLRLKCVPPGYVPRSWTQGAMQ